MPILTEQRKRQRNLIIVFSLVAIVTLLVLSFGRLRQGLPETAPAGEELEIAKGAREIRLNVNLLTEEKFKELIPYERLSRKIMTGRNNPFVPYSVQEPAYVRELIEEEALEILPSATTTNSTTTSL